MTLTEEFEDKKANMTKHTDISEMVEGPLNYRLDLLLRTGCLLMENAADASRIMRTMRRVAAFLGLPREDLLF